MESVEDIQSRHKKELKELTGQITALKKTISKGAADKKKKKDVQDQITAMEAEIKGRHEKELAEAQCRPANADEPEPQQSVEAEDLAEVKTAISEMSLSNDAETADTTPSTGPKKKTNRQKERKARKAAEMEEMRRQAAEEVANAPNMREVEMAAIVAASKPLVCTMLSHISYQ
ncbi:OTU domain-containing protein 6B [Phlyctochytrium planicorne]|nr:OTU domain-containing protein 6B [Phlyctochytrium planicorne]